MPASRSVPVRTHCPYCALQCGIAMTPAGPGTGRGPALGEQAGAAAYVVAGASPAGTPLDVTPRTDVATNAGGLCQKGWTAADLLSSPERLTRPLMRDRSEGPDAQFRAVSWEVALDRIAAELTEVRDAHGADANGIFGSGGLTNEKAYLLGKFVRLALGSPNHRLQRPLLHGVGGGGAEPGLRHRPRHALPGHGHRRTKTLMLWGANFAETMPPIMQWVHEQRAAGGQLIVVDPRRTETARAAHAPPAADAGHGSAAGATASCTWLIEES